LQNLVEKYGYLPYSHIKALEELTPAEILFALEIKFKNEGVFENTQTHASAPSPLVGEGEVLGELASRRNSGEGYTVVIKTTSAP